MAENKVYPIAFTTGGSIWASNGWYYGNKKNYDWWDLPEEGSRRTNYEALSKRRGYIVVGVMRNHCYARHNNKIYCRRQDRDAWYIVTTTTQGIVADSIFVPSEEMFSGVKKATAEIDTLGIIASPDWFKMSNNTCYFCGVSGCEHLARLA